MTDFVHLHLHTEYSLLDGACRINKYNKKDGYAPLFAKARELSQKAIAITDHGVMFGVVDFYKNAKQAGLKPIIGCEVYVAPRTRLDKTHEKDSANYHLILLAKNMTGYHNLVKIVSFANTEGFYIKPRCDMQLLRENSEGLIALSACIAGQVPQLILQDEFEKAKSVAAEFKEIFGEDYYLELQNHGLEDQLRVNAGLLKIAKELNIELVATNDVHYIEKQDAKAQQVLMCIQTGKTMDDEDKMDFGSDEFYLKSGDEMAELFAATPEAIANTVKIAEKCNVEFEFHKLSLPKYDPPDGMDAFEYLNELCEKGFERRYGPAAPDGARERMKFELETIKSMGYVDYFLIVWDFINYARGQKIPVGPGRGSAAGSIVSYCLHITDIEPLSLNLLFERFLNPERISMPDIDVDFCFERRQEVIDYVVHKYGADHVAQIVTFGTMLAKGALRDVGRALNMPYAEVDAVAKLVPNVLKITLDDALALPELSELYNSDERIKNLFDMAKKLEGMPRHSSIHAAGVVITDKPVYQIVPLLRSGAQTADMQNIAVTQFTMGTLEELGLLKMDFLALRNLTVIDRAEKIIRAGGGECDTSALAFDDAEVYKMLSSGRTEGVFQLESGGMKNVLVNLKPRSIEDVIAVISLFRPGPMQSIPKYIENMHHPEKVTFKHPLLKDILGVTYGCLVYQEQVMQIVRVLAGYSYGRADLVRRAMSKKKADAMEKERAVFIHGGDGVPGAVSRGVPEKVANEIFDEMSAFAEYAFNKSHAAAYAVVAYRTAYLKAHYPREYMAALLTSVLDSPDKVSEYIAECLHMGFEVLAPDVNRSEVGFAVEKGGIRFGLVAIKNIGYSVINCLVAERERGGPFQSFSDFLNRMFGKELNKKAVEGLILSGALDSLGLGRRQMMMSYEAVLDDMAENKRRNVEGQLDLFGAENAPREYEFPAVAEYPAKEKLTREKEVTGYYLSGHPLMEHQKLIAARKTTEIRDILASFSGDEQETAGALIADGQYVTVAGIISAKKQKMTKSGQMMAFLTLEDLGGTIEVIVFPKTLAEQRDLLAQDAVVFVEGRVSAREDEEPKLVLQRASDVTSKRGKLFIKVPAKGSDEMSKALAAAAEHRGQIPLVLYFEDSKTYAEAARALWTDGSQELLAKLKAALGDRNVILK